MCYHRTRRRSHRHSDHLTSPTKPSIGRFGTDQKRLRRPEVMDHLLPAKWPPIKQFSHDAVGHNYFPIAIGITIIRTREGKILLSNPSHLERKAKRKKKKNLQFLTLITREVVLYKFKICATEEQSKIFPQSYSPYWRRRQSQNGRRISENGS